MLLIPEGVLALNDTAAAALELVNGDRTMQHIVDAIVARFDVTPDEARDGLGELFERLALRGFILR